MSSTLLYLEKKELPRLRNKIAQLRKELRLAELAAEDAQRKIAQLQIDEEETKRNQWREEKLQKEANKKQKVDKGT